VTEAIIGLVGVVVGGLLTAAVQIFQDWRAERTNSRAAARLLSAELSVQQLILMRRASDQHASPDSDGMPTVTDWPAQRAVMAKVLDDDKWIDVAGAYATLVIWHSENRRSRAAADARRTEMAALADQLETARYSLQRFRSVSDRRQNGAADEESPPGGG
jgi:hypothetical protein